MKKTVFTLFSILALTYVISGQALRSSVIVETDIFKVEYSEVLEQPIWLEYKVQCPNGKASRSGMDFWVPKGIHTSDDMDYANNIWDKGHLAPAAAFNCSKEMLRKTFSYLNSALQHESLNRGVWNKLEEFERNLANFYEVNVRIDVLFEGKCEVLPTGATIPSGFKKTIKWDGRTAIFVFPNTDTKGSNWIDFYQSK
jgi:endonuclease G